MRRSGLFFAKSRCRVFSRISLSERSAPNVFIAKQANANAAVSLVWKNLINASVEKTRARKYTRRRKENTRLVRVSRQRRFRGRAAVVVRGLILFRRERLSIFSPLMASVFTNTTLSRTSRLFRSNILKIYLEHSESFCKRTVLSFGRWCRLFIFRIVWPVERFFADRFVRV